MAEKNFCLDCGGSVSFYFRKRICIYCERAYVAHNLCEQLEWFLCSIDLAYVVISYFASSEKPKTLSELVVHRNNMGSSPMWFDSSSIRIKEYWQINLKDWIDIKEDNERIQKQQRTLFHVIKHRHFNYRDSIWTCEIWIDFLKDISKLACLLWCLGYEWESELLFGRYLYGELFSTRLIILATLQVRSKLITKLNPRAKEWYPHNWRKHR